MQRTAAKSYEIETWLRDRLRTRGFYERLAFIKIQPSSRAECGWRSNSTANSRKTSAVKSTFSPSSCSGYFRWNFESTGSLLEPIGAFEHPLPARCM
jgi:hypothetical protein